MIAANQPVIPVRRSIDAPDARCCYAKSTLSPRS